jgi:hypothetical protein
VNSRRLVLDLGVGVQILASVDHADVGEPTTARRIMVVQREDFIVWLVVRGTVLRSD